MNKKIMVAVEDAFIERFGPWAGWAHNTLFISELATQRERLPEHLRPGGKVKASKSQKASKGSAVELLDQSASLKVEEDAVIQKRGLDTDLGVAPDHAGNDRAGNGSKPTKRARKGVKKEQESSMHVTAAEQMVDDSGIDAAETSKGSDLLLEPGQKPEKKATGKQKFAKAHGVAGRTSRHAQSTHATAAAAVDQAVEDAVDAVHHTAGSNSEIRT